MKHTLFILALITASIQTFAQSPRIKLNQITKDSVIGSVLISSPTDSGMVYSRDLFISYGADTVLILGGDTLAATSSIISSVLSDGVTVLGNGTTGDELRLDTFLIATINALNDSLAGLSYATNQDISDSLQGFATLQDITDTLDLNARGYLTSEVDGSVTNEIQDISTTGAAGNISISDGSTLNLNVNDADASATNEGSLTVGVGGGNDAVISSNTSGSSDVTISGGTNVTVTENTGTNTITIAASGGGAEIPVDTFVTIAGAETITGAKTFTAALTQSGGDVNFDSGTLFVDESTNRVGIGTTSPSATFDMQNGSGALFEVEYTEAAGGEGVKFIDSDDNTSYLSVLSATSNDTVFLPTFNITRGTGQANTTTGVGGYFGVDIHNSLDVKEDNRAGLTVFAYEDGSFSDKVDFANVFMARNGSTPYFTVQANGDIVFNDYGLITDLRLNSEGKLYDGASDERLKNSIEDIDFGLGEIMKLQPKAFWRNDDTQNYDLKEIGFIAQEVRYIIPNAVVNSKSGYFQLRTDAILATTVKAIQEQQSIIESQATEIETLKYQIQLILNEIEQLKNN